MLIRNIPLIPDRFHIPGISLIRNANGYHNAYLFEHGAKGTSRPKVYAANEYYIHIYKQTGNAYQFSKQVTT